MALICLDTMWITLCRTRCSLKDDVIEYDVSKEVGSFWCPRCAGDVNHVKVGIWMLNDEPLVDRRGMHRLWIT